MILKKNVFIFIEFMSLRVDVEELVLELFALVNEKNELFRRQAELMLLRRQQRLEEEHADVEYQIRCLMSQPEATKTDSDKQREEVLIQRFGLYLTLILFTRLLGLLTVLKFSQN